MSYTTTIQVLVYDIELWIDTFNHTTLSLNRGNGEFLKFEDIIDEHNNLN